MDFILRTNRGENQNPVFWEDSSANDYIHRDDALKGYCLYEFTMDFEKKYKTFKEMRDETENGTYEDEKDDGVANRGVCQICSPVILPIHLP